MRVPALDGVRGLAAIAVVAQHYMLVWFFLAFASDSVESYSSNWLDQVVLSGMKVLTSGHSAVVLFFVLSGAALSNRFFQSQHDVGGLAGATAKRYLRLMLPIVGAYIVVSVLFQFNLFAMSDLVAIADSGFGNLYKENMGAYAFFLTALVGVPIMGHDTLNPPLWTIQIELIGSLLVFGILTFAHSQKVRFLVYGVSVLLLWDSYLLGFVVGVGLCEIYYKSSAIRALTEKHPVVAVSFFMSGLILLVYSDILPSWFRIDARFLPQVLTGFYDPRVPLQVFGAALLLIGVLYSKGISSILTTPAFRYLGEISFPLYLIHFPIMGSISSIGFLWLYSGGSIYMPFLFGFGLVGFPISIILADIFARLINRPAIVASGIVGIRVNRYFL